MPKLPIISGKNLIKVLRKNCFVVLRKKGSHVYMESEDGLLSTVVPLHANEDLGKGLLKSILNDLEISVGDFVSMLK